MDVGVGLAPSGASQASSGGPPPCPANRTSRRPPGGRLHAPISSANSTAASQSSSIRPTASAGHPVASGHNASPAFNAPSMTAA